MTRTKRFTVALAAVLFVVSAGLHADDGNVRARQLAKFQDTASELASLWISYALGDPGFFPNLEDGAVDCQIHQPSPSAVTVLTGNFFGGDTVRSCTVPTGAPLFFPVINCFFVNADTGIPCASDGDCPPSTTCGMSSTCIESFSVDEKVALCEEFLVDYQCGMQVELDGELLYPSAQDIPLLRTASHPTPGYLPTGDFDPETIATGHWALIPALSEGAHTLEFRGSARGPDGVCGSGFSLDVTYLLTVVDTE